MLTLIKEKVLLNSSRVYLENFLQRAAISIPAGATVLDAGAGDGKYRPLFSHARYYTTDLLRTDKVYGKVTFCSDLREIPIRTDTYDFIVCTQVLEHIPEPKIALQELYRILRPGGHLWLSTPLFFEEHEVPFDYYRYTQYGLSYLFEQAGFEIKQMEWLEGYYGTLAYQFKGAARDIPATPRGDVRGSADAMFALLMFIVKGTLVLFAILFTQLDLRHKYTKAGYCKNYVVVARKPASP